MAEFVTNLGSWTLQSIEIAKSPDEEFKQGFSGTCAAAGGEQKQVTSLAFSLG